MRFVKRQEKKIIEKWGNKNEFLTYNKILKIVEKTEDCDRCPVKKRCIEFRNMTSDYDLCNILSNLLAIEIEER